ncbi:hypothetical protein ABFS82_07G034500 [Erythranthe guttata]
MAIKFNTKVLSLLLVLIVTFSLLLVQSQCHTKYQEEQEEEEEKTAEESLFECFVTCSRHRQNDHELTDCEQRCVKQYQETKKQEGQEGSRRHGGGGGEGTVENHHRQDEPAAQRFKQCQSRCGKQEQGQQRQYCQQKCQWEYEKQKREEEQQHGGGRGGGDPTNAKKESKEEEKQQRQNPYFFDSQRFDSKYRTEQGHIKILERFSKNSDLLQGIENYRLAILEANPNTFVLPHHCDAESVFLVVGGRGTISYVWEKQRKSYNLKSGGVLWVPAGSIVYLTNNDDNERLYILKLLQPVNTPGKFKEYFGVGGENPESFYSSFSNEILEAAFNTQSEKLQRLFGQQSKGVIIKASKEQIRALSQESESSPRGRREKESSSWGPIDLLNERPVFSNEFGQYFEASPNHYQQLRDLDVSVLLVNITKGAMVAPYYNSKSTRLVFVVGGSGYFEMACPHLANAKGKHGSQGRKERQGEIITDVHYQKVSARLSVGDAFVVPAGHPIAIVASQDSNLQLAGFGIKASHNQKYFLAGQENVWNEVQSEAKELAFRVPAREVEEIFRSQEQSYFMPGPGQKGKGQRHVASILDFVGF